jgi:hypothetical protein
MPSFKRREPSSSPAPKREPKPKTPAAASKRAAGSRATPPAATETAALEQWLAPSTSSAIDQVEVRLIDDGWAPERIGQAPLEATLAAIQAVGVVEPVLLRPGGEGRYSVVTGHRTVEAARSVGMDRVPSVVKELDEVGALMALVFDGSASGVVTHGGASELRRRLRDAGAAEDDIEDVMAAVPVADGAEAVAAGAGGNGAVVEVGEEAWSAPAAGTDGEHAAAEPEPAAAEPEADAPEPEPVAAEPEAVAPESEPVAAEPEPAAPEPEPVAAEPEMVAPEAEPVAAEAEAVVPEPEPVAAEPQAAAPEPAPVAAEPEAAPPEPEPAAAETEPEFPAAETPLEPVVLPDLEPIAVPELAPEPAEMAAAVAARGAGPEGAAAASAGRWLPLPAGRPRLARLSSAFADAPRMLRILATDRFTGTAELVGRDGRKDAIAFLDGRILATYVEQGERRVDAPLRLPSPERGPTVEITVRPHPRAVSVALALALRSPARFTGLHAAFLHLDGLLSLLRREGTDAACVVTSSKGSGVILLDAGQPVAAYARRWGDEPGEEAETTDVSAVLDMLTTGNGEVDVHTGDVPEPLDLDEVVARSVPGD